MSAVLVDTNAIIWYISSPEMLSSLARSMLDEANAGGSAIYVASISIVEIVYLVERRRNPLPASILENLIGELRSVESNFTLVPLDIDGAYATRDILRDAVPDMPDRIITATAQSMGIPLLTSDSRIRDAIPNAVW